MGLRRLSEAADTPPIGLSMNRILVYTDHICFFFIYIKKDLAISISISILYLYLLHPFQNVSRFGFFRFIVFAIHLDIT